MRKLISLVAAIFAIAVIMLCSATGAFAGEITSLDSNFTQDTFDPGSVTINASMTQAAPQSTVTTTLFVVLAWDNTCSQAGYPGGPIDPMYAYLAADHSSSLASANFSDNVSGLPQNVGFCVGAAATSDDITWTISAQHLYFNKPYIDIRQDAAGEHLITVDYDVHPNGLATTHWLSYFKQVNTDQCNSPDPDDLATAQDTPHESIADDLDNPHTINGAIDNLEIETQYCIGFRASNMLGDDISTYWSFETTGSAPVIDDVNYTVDATHIYYGFDVTPGTNLNDVEVDIQYFEPTGAGCTIPPNPTSTWYHVFTNTPRGFSPIHETGFVDGLTAGTTYCIRPIGINMWAGSDPIPFESITTTAPAAATISDPQISPPTAPGTDAKLSVSIGDGGAQAAINTISDYNVYVHHVTAARCNEAEFSGGTTILDDSDWFTDEQDLSYDLDNLVLGENYCIAVFVDSAWGDAYDAVVFKSFVFGAAAPLVTGVTSDPNLTSIDFGATVNPGYLDTDYGVKYQLKPPATSCASLSSGWTIKQQSIAGSDATGHAVAVTATGLTPDTDYCAYFYATNSISTTSTPISLVHTDADATPPSVPTGLAPSNVAQATATLSWGASTDNVGVTGYKVFKGGTQIATPAGLSTPVTLACGAGSSFTVAAFDAAGNTSAQSAPLIITGAACDVPPSPPADPTPSPAEPAAPSSKECFDDFSSKKASGKAGKKKIAVIVSGSTSADGQSLTITAKAKSTKAAFKVDGKAVTAKNGSIVITGNPSLATVSFKIGKKLKTIKLAIGKHAC
jgi:hypothetical protein